MYILKIIVLVIVVIIVLGIALVCCAVIPKTKVQNIWSNNCGSDGQQLLVMRDFEAGGLAPGHDYLAVTLESRYGKELFRTVLASYSDFPLGIDASNFSLWPFNENSKNVSIIFEGAGRENFDDKGHSNKVNIEYYPPIRDCIIKNKSEIEKTIVEFAKKQKEKKDSIKFFESNITDVNIVLVAYKTESFSMEFKNKAFLGTTLRLGGYQANVEYRIPKDQVLHSSSMSNYRGEDLGNLFLLEKDVITRKITETKKNLKEYIDPDKDKETYRIKYLEASMRTLDFLLKNIDSYINEDGKNIFEYRDVVLKKFKDVPKEYFIK